jgi:hypothetical protein
VKSENIHLDEDQVIYSVVDENSLTATIRNHLYSCPICQRKKQQMEQELHNLGGMAKKFAPLPRKEFRLPLHKTPISWSWRPVFATGFAAIILIAVIWWSTLFTPSQKKMMAKNILEMEKDQQLMAEIFTMEEYAPLDFYPDISVESYISYFDEFMEFVVSMEENQKDV